MCIRSFMDFFNKLWLDPRLTDSSAGARGGRAAQQSALEAIDRKMMERCIALSRRAAADGEMPFAALICRGEGILVEATNQVRCCGDATRHAEMVALSEAQRALGHKRLTGCTLYSNVEPCAMCSWPIRESGVSRVVFSIKSPLFGGLSRWNVLGDLGISNVMRGYFRKPPQIVGGVLLHEAAQVWREARPLLWNAMEREAQIEPIRPAVLPVSGPAKARAQKRALRASNVSRVQKALRPRRPAIAM
jgi:tRNA(adenine34) deaminase